MRKVFLPLFIVFLLWSKTFAAEETTAPAGVLRHIVMVQFKKETTPETVKALELQFASLEKSIDTIIDFEWGLASTVEKGMDQGFTHCFVVTFKDKAGLEVYLPHEAHLAFVEVFKPEIEKVLVLDYVAQ